MRSIKIESLKMLFFVIFVKARIQSRSEQDSIGCQILDSRLRGNDDILQTVVLLTFCGITKLKGANGLKKPFGPSSFFFTHELYRDLIRNPLSPPP